MSSITAEPKYEPVEKSASKEDLEVAEILTTMVETASADESTRIFNTMKESEIPSENASENRSSQNVGSPHIFSSNANENADVPKPSSQDYPLDPSSLLNHTLLDLITKMVSDHELQKKYELPIDARYIECLKQITEKHPNYFASFESSLMAIVKDGRISVADFPEIVKMVMELYIVLHSVHPKDIVDMCSNVLKTVFFIAVKEKIIVVENENDVIAAFDSFIDSIVELLKMHIQLSGSWDNITCNFGKLFGF